MIFVRGSKFSDNPSQMLGNERVSPPLFLKGDIGLSRIASHSSRKMLKSCTHGENQEVVRNARLPKGL